jgi:hypothetical protein
MEKTSPHTRSAQDRQTFEIKRPETAAIGKNGSTRRSRERLQNSHNPLQLKVLSMLAQPLFVNRYIVKE